jgi:hypothetical protein
VAVTLTFLSIDVNPFLSWTGSHGPLAGLSQCHVKLVVTRLEGTTMSLSAMTPRKASHPMLIETSYGPLFSDSDFLFFVFLFAVQMRFGG